MAGIPARQGRPPGSRNKSKDDPVSRRLAEHCERHIEQQIEAIGAILIPKMLAQMNTVFAAFGIEPTSANQRKLVKLVAQVFNQVAIPADQIPVTIAQRMAHAWHDDLALNYIDKALAELGGAKEERHEHNDNDVG
jgi:hypothetical protein